MNNTYDIIETIKGKEVKTNWYKAGADSYLETGAARCRRILEGDKVNFVADGLYYSMGPNIIVDNGRVWVGNIKSDIHPRLPYTERGKFLQECMDDSYCEPPFYAHNTALTKDEIKHMGWIRDGGDVFTKTPKDFWITADYTTVHPTEMDNKHIVNVIKRFIKHEPIPRGVEERFASVCREAQRRGLFLLL